MNVILWDPSPELLSLGPISVRYYGLMFALSFLVSQQIMLHIFRKEGKAEEDLDDLTIYMIVATVIGARLGHVLFYDFDKYFYNFQTGEVGDLLGVFKIWEGGLASHGASIALPLTIWLYTKYKMSLFPPKATPVVRRGQNFWWVVDRLVIVVAISGCFIRFGNFMNSEIVGKPAHVPQSTVFGRWAEDYVVNAFSNVSDVEIGEPDKDFAVNEAHVPVMMTVQFKGNLSEEQAIKDARNILVNLASDRLYSNEFIKVGRPGEGTQLYSIEQGSEGTIAKLYLEGVPRHPAQLYESISCLFLFVILFLIWKRHKEKLPQGLLFGSFLIILFGLRFVYEFYKENQVAFEDELPLNMGQWLSIPLVLVGTFIVIRSLRRGKTSEEM